MAAILEEELKELDADVEWLHNNYNELINKCNEEFVATKSRLEEHTFNRDHIIRNSGHYGLDP